jgi:hypothetical protein
VWQAARARPPAFDVLVVAACSNNPQIAESAQLAIADAFTRCQRQIDDALASDATSELSALIGALAQQREAVSAADPSWALQTVHSALRLANRLPASDLPGLAAKCDALINAFHSANRSFNQDTQPAPPLFVPTRGGGISATIDLQADDVIDGREPMRLEATDVTSLASQPWHGDSDIKTYQGETTQGPQPDAVKLPATNPLRSSVPLPSIESPRPEPDPSPSRPAEAENPGPSGDTAAAQDQPPSLSDMGSRQLLIHWRTARSELAAGIEQELIQRGFGRISGRQVDLFLSINADDRIRLMNEVTKQPGLGARSWLLLLADDANAEVRWHAVTIMATSRDSVLLDKAYQVALRDTDPRIADLAGRLHERRSRSKR